MSSYAEAGTRPFARARQAKRERKLRASHRLEQIYNLVDFEAAARKLLPPAIYSYVASGSEDETTATRSSITGSSRGCCVT